MQKITTVITDLDNTLWNWVDIWHSTFTSSLNQGVQEYGNVTDYLNHVKNINQVFNSSEGYLFSSFPSILYKTISHILKDSHKVNRSIKMYSGSKAALIELRNSGINVIGYTESQSIHTALRLNLFGLDGIFSKVYCQETLGWEDVPLCISETDIQTYDGHYFRKPETTILKRILDENHLSKEQVIYIGDHIIKDVCMAQSMGILSCYAKYGEEIEEHTLKLLRRVCHWSDSQIQFEKNLRENPDYSSVCPDRTFNEGFHEVINWIKELNEQRT